MTPKQTGGFAARDRLLSSRDFMRVREQGRAFTSRHFILSIAMRGEGVPGGKSPRLGVTVSRRVGNSVARNHVKRRIREWFRAARRRVEGPKDVVVIARQGAAERSGREIADELESLLDRFL